VDSLTDPVSGQPASKSAPVAIRPLAVVWYGFAVSTRPITPACDYWARAVLPGGHQAELAGLVEPGDWPEAARAMLGMTGEPLVVRDPRKGLLRMAFVADGRLQGALFISPEPAALSRSHVIASLGASCGGDILAGRPGAEQSDAGALVCACLGVGMNTILQGIATQKLMTVEAIGKALGAGTNCGSCRPELKGLLEAAREQAGRGDAVKQPQCDPV
jgi:assimilatory nitrate reductase catalytic subunit